MLSPNSQERYSYKTNHVLDILLQDDDDIFQKEAENISADHSATRSGRKIEATDVDSYSVKPVGTPRARRSLALGQPIVAKPSPLKRRRGNSNSSDDDFQPSTRTPSKRAKTDQDEAVLEKPTRASVTRTPSRRTVTRTPSKRLADTPSKAKTPSQTRTPSKRLASDTPSKTKTPSKRFADTPSKTKTPSKTPNKCETPSRKTRTQTVKTETPKSSRRTPSRRKVELQPLHKEQEASLQKRMETLHKKGAQRTPRRKGAVKEVVITSDGSGQIQTQEEVVSMRGRV